MKTVSWIRWRKTVREKSIGPKVTICDTGTTGLLHKFLNNIYALYGLGTQLRNRSVTLLLSYSPCCSFTCQTFSVSINNLHDRFINFRRVLNDFSRARFLCMCLRLRQIVFRVLLVMVFTPSPVLNLKLVFFFLGFSVQK